MKRDCYYIGIIWNHSKDIHRSYNTFTQRVASFSFSFLSTKTIFTLSIQLRQHRWSTVLNYHVSFESSRCSDIYKRDCTISYKSGNFFDRCRQCICKRKKDIGWSTAKKGDWFGKGAKTKVSTHRYAKTRMFRLWTVHAYLHTSIRWLEWQTRKRPILDTVHNTAFKRQRRLFHYSFLRFAAKL